jgi:hypothetical protein
MLCALVRENIVVQVLELSEEEIQSYGRIYERVVDISQMTPTPSAGWTVNSNGLFVEPEGSSSSRVITRLAFMNRFKDNEIGAVYTIANTAAHPLYIPFKIYIDKILASTFIDLARPDTIASLELISSLGILSSARVNEIISTPVSYTERPQK